MTPTHPFDILECNYNCGYFNFLHTNIHVNDLHMQTAVVTEMTFLAVRKQKTTAFYFRYADVSLHVGLYGIRYDIAIP